MATLSPQESLGGQTVAELTKEHICEMLGLDMESTEKDIRKLQGERRVSLRKMF